MKNTEPSNNVTHAFVARHAEDVIGILSGFDRLRLRGTLRSLYQPSVLLRYLYLCQVMLKGFKNYSMNLTRRILEGAEQMAKKANRPWVYLNSTRICKEDIARRIARESPVAEGLVGIRLASCGVWNPVRPMKFGAYSRCLPKANVCIFTSISSIRCLGSCICGCKRGFPFRLRFASMGGNGWPGNWIRWV